VDNVILIAVDYKAMVCVFFISTVVFHRTIGINAFRLVFWPTYMNILLRTVYLIHIK